MAALIHKIFWLDFCTVGGGRDVHFHVLYVKVSTRFYSHTSCETETEIQMPLSASHCAYRDNANMVRVIWYHVNLAQPR